MTTLPLRNRLAFPSSARTRQRRSTHSHPSNQQIHISLLESQRKRQADNEEISWLDLSDLGDIFVLILDHAQDE